MAVTPLLPGDPVELGRFTITGRLGSGGMGVVYFGVDANGVRAAVKVIHAELAADPTFRIRFRREAAASKRLVSQVAAQVLDSDADGTPAWIAFEFIDGPTLAEMIRQGPLRPSVAVGILAGIAEALVDIGAVGLVHRDLKPSNVMNTPLGVRVIDFGIAQRVDDTRLTASGHQIGSKMWMSPERLRGDTATEASDVFAWGCVAAEALTGRHPFAKDGDDVAIVINRILNEEPDLRDLPAGFEALVRATLAKRPNERPTASRLVSELVPDDSRTLIDTVPPTIVGGPTPDTIVAAPTYNPTHQSRRWVAWPVALAVAAVVAAGVWWGAQPSQKKANPPVSQPAASAETTAPPATSPTTAPTTVSPTTAPTTTSTAVTSTSSPTSSPPSIAPVNMLTPDNINQFVVFRSGDLAIDSTTIGGVQANYAAFENCGVGCGGFQQNHIDFNLLRNYKQFVATVGLTDLSQTGGRQTVTIMADGVQLYQRTFVAGQSERITRSVVGVYRVSVIFTGTDNTSKYHGAIGDPTIS